MDIPTLGLDASERNQKAMRGLLTHTIINRLQIFKIIIYIIDP